jgi:hypothetical protein
MVIMQVSRQSVVDTLRQMGLDLAAEEALKQLPDPVDLDQVNMLCDRLAISRGELISRMGGSPLQSGGGCLHGKHPAWIPASRYRIGGPAARTAAGRPG